MFGFNFLTKASKPLAVDTANCAGFKFAPRPAMQFGFYLPDLGKVNTTVANLESVVLRVSDTVVLAFAFEFGIAWGIAFLHAVKEGVEGKVYAVNDILQDLAVDFFEFGMVFLPGRQVRLLREVAHGDFGGVVLELPVFDEAIVNESAGFESGF